MRDVRAVHHLVRQHHRQPRPDLPQRGPRRQHGLGAGAVPHGEAACYLAAALLRAAQVRGPYRHYVLNLLWILTLLFCLLLAAHHLRQLHRQASTCHQPQN